MSNFIMIQTEKIDLKKNLKMPSKMMDKSKIN